MPPITSTTSATIGNSFRNADLMDSSSASTEDALTSPIISGFQVAMPRISSAKAAARMIPGTTAAINKMPTDCSARKPYTIRSRLGGMSMPRTDEPATTPTENRGV